MANTTNVQILIENIRTAMAYSDQTPPDTMRQYASEYAEQCRTLNERFKEILPFIKNDNVAEAVRHAEMPPNVIDHYTALDFDGREDWRDICDGLGFEIPTPLPMELFQQLQDAYNSFEPLKHLLQHNRLLALNGSPVRDRLIVIRQLAQKDLQNTFWAADQEHFEKVRLTQLDAEVKQALAAKNDLQIRLLYQELAMPGWRAAPPPKYRAALVEYVVKGYAEILDKQANAYDYDAAQRTYRQILQTLQADNLSMPQSIANFIAPALQWMSMERQTQENADNYNEAESELRYALDSDETQHELENLYYALSNAAIQANLALPPDLEQRYRERIDGLEHKAIMKRRTILAAVLGTCVVFAGLIGTGIWFKMRSSEIAKVLSVLLEIEDEKRFEDIEKTVEKVETNKPDIAKAAEVAAQIAKLQSMLEEDNKRAKDFERYAVQAETALDSKPSFDELKPVAGTLEQAVKFARTDSEKERLKNLQGQYQRQTKSRQREIDTKFGEDLAELNKEFGDIPRSAKDKAMFDALTSVEQKIKELLERSSNVSLPQLNEGKELRTLITERQKRIKDAVAEDAAFQKLFEQTPDMAKYKTAFNDFLLQHPKHSAVDDIEAVVKNLDKIQGVFSAVRNLCSEYNECLGDCTKLQAAAPQIQQQCTALTGEISSPINVLFAPEAEIQRFGSTKPFSRETFDDADSILQLISRKDLYPVITEDEKWYYCDKPLVRNEKKPLFVTSYASSGKPYAPTKYDYERSDETKELKLKRQMEWAVDTLKELDKIKSGAVSKTDKICTILAEMCSLEGLDPILKVVMLEKFVGSYAKTDPVFAEVFDDVQNKIGKSKVDMGTNWLDVESSTTVLERQKSAALLKQLPDFKKLSDDVQKKTAEFHKKLKDFSPQFQLLGLLYKDSSDWMVKPLPPDVRDGWLLVFFISGEKAKPQIIGSIKGGKVSIAASVRELRQCLLVFLRQDAKIDNSLTRSY